MELEGEGFTGTGSAAAEKETEAAAEWEDGGYEPRGILKRPKSYEDAIHHSVEPQDLEKTDHARSSKKEEKKLQPFWRLFRFANWLDLLMIAVGVVTGFLSGAALPGHMLLFGQVINQFVYFTQVDGFLEDTTTLNETVRCNRDLAGPALMKLLTNTSNNSYFCAESGGGEIFDELLNFVCEPSETLKERVGVYSYYYVAIAVGVMITTFLSNALWNMSAYRQTQRMRMAFYRAVLYQEIGWFDVTESAQLSTRLADDIERVQSGIGDKVAVFLSYFSSFITGFIVAFSINWKMALVVFTMLPLLTFVTVIISKIVATFSVREQSAYAVAGAVAEEVLSSIRTVMAFGGEDKEAARYEVPLKRARSVGIKKSFFTSIAVGSLYLIMFCTFALGFWFGSILILDCELSAGDVVTVFFSVVIGSFSLGNALPELETFATAVGAITVIYEVIDKESQIDVSSTEGEVPDDLSGNIQFSDVVFHYPARPDVQVLRGLDLKVSSGQTVALVGPSGCGKSTTVQLIQRFYNADAGQITLDGRDIRSLNLKWLRSNIGVVSQEPVLFDTTIAENIGYGKEGATMEEIETAAKNANAHDFISHLPDGYSTLVGERGAQLSGGQKQRLAIARALVRNPKILLLDEATSALDTESEKIVQDALDKAREGRTTIVIAHRLSTIQTADVIASIEGGRVVEWGTHVELMDNEGLYYELVTAQIYEEKEETGDDLAQFKAAVRRTSYKRSQSLVSERSHHSSFQRQASTESSRGGFQRQASTESSRGGFQRQASTESSRGGFQRQASTESHRGGLQRQASTQSSRGGFQRQTSTGAGGGQDVFWPIVDALSRLSVEDIAIGTHPSPAHGRTVFLAGDEVEVEPQEKVVRFVEPPADTTSGATPSKKHWWGRHKHKNTGDKEELEETGEEKIPEVKFYEMLKLNLPDWPLILLGITMSAIVGCLFPVQSILFSEMLEVFGESSREEIEQGVSGLALGFVGLAVGAGIAHFTASFSLGTAGERLTKRIRLKTFQAMLRQDISWYDHRGHSTGALTTRLAVDASEVKGATGLRLGVIFQTVSGFLAAVVIAFSASWELSLVLMFCFPILASVGYLQVRFLIGRTAKNKTKLEESGKTAVESIDNVRTVVSLGIEEMFITRYESLLQYPFKSSKRSVFATAIVFALAQSLIFFIYAAGYSFGAFLVAEGRNSYDQIFRTYAAVVFTALTLGRASSFAPDASKAQASAARILHLFERKPPIDTTSPDGMKPANTSGEIDVKEAHFRYPTRLGVPVLQGLNVSVKPGQTLALVGPSGCGKSTVVSLIERFYDPLLGSLTLDGTDLKDLNIRWLRSQVGIVSQEPVLFDATIAENIRYGANFRKVSDEEVVEAAKAANIHTFIDSLPQGYNTNVGSKGTQLSGGQKQRIAIARALVRNPKILLLDEATSALDTESEKIVQEALDKAREGRTSIVIAHRLSTIYNANCIAVIHNGKVIESGTHSELMAQGGAYYHLNTVQLQDVDDDEEDD